ncbi:hypothetical protein D3C72_2321140 [compost metagenome]
MYLCQQLIVDAPVRLRLFIARLRQQLFQSGKKTEGVGAAVQYVGQMEIFGLLVKMPIAIADKTYAAAA